MKRFAVILIIGLVCVLSGCTSLVSQIQERDAAFAQYYKVPEFDLDCKAGIVKCDMDVSADPVSIRRSEAILRYADQYSDNFKQCYGKTAWIYWSGAKIEGAVRAWARRLVELGVMNP